MYNVAIVGATGNVGRKFLSILEEREFPVKNLYLFASARSKGKKMTFKGKEYIVEETIEENIKSKDIDFALFSAGGDTSLEFAPIFSKYGAVVIDNSSAWRMDPKVPLVVPEVNPEDIKWHNGIIANPNCSTIQAMPVLKVINDKFSYEKVTITYFKNKTLMLQGNYGVLWEKVCQIIEATEKINNVTGILNRICGNNEIEIKDDSQKNLVDLCGDKVYTFLSNEDREYLQCAYELILEERKFVVYTPILCSAALALEGYFKLVLLNLKMVKQIDLAKSNFSFHCIFKDGKITDEYSSKIVTNKDRRLIEKELERIYSKIRSYRHPVCHSGAGKNPGVLRVKSFVKCKELFLNEYINTMKNSYKIIFD